MRKNFFGKIVNLTSIRGKIYDPSGSWYHSTKFAVERLSDCLRLKLKPFGIDVIIVEPGATLTEWGAIATIYCILNHWVMILSLPILRKRI